MAFTKFKSLTERLLSGLGRSKTFFPFYDSQNDADYRVSLDTLITFISNELGVSSKAVFELTGVTNTGNNYISTLDISSYRTEGLYIFKPSADSDNTSSLNVNSVGILDIKEFDGTDLVDKIDLKAVNTYLLLNKTSYWLVVGGVSGGTGGVSTFSALTDSPYDNTLLAEALNSKQERINGIVSGCIISVETFVGVGTNKRVRVTNGTWYITPSEYTKATDTVSAEITLCVTGGDFKYYDIVADTSGTITIHEGTPSTSPAHYVINPLTQVLLGFITVGDAVIEEPTLAPTAGLETFFENVYVSAGIATLDCREKAFPRFSINSLDSSPLELVINNTFGVVELSLEIDIPSPNSDKGLITLPAFCYPTTYQINDNARFYSVKMTKYLGLLFCDFQPLSEVSLKQNIPQVKSASFVAQNDNNYVTDATATVTDPSPIEGKGYDVLVLSGTVTVGGTPYATAGTYIRRRYVSGSWVNYVGGGGATELSVINRDLDSLEIDSSTGVGTGAVIESATTSLAGLQSAADKTKLDGAALTTYVDTQDKKFNFKLSFVSSTIIEDYWIDGGTVNTITKSAGISILEYSVNNGSSFSTTVPFTIIAGTRIIWKATFASSELSGSANCKGSYTNII